MKTFSPLIPILLAVVTGSDALAAPRCRNGYVGVATRATRAALESVPTSPVAGLAPGRAVVVPINPRPPQLLYHWGSAETLRRIAAASTPDRLALSRMGADESGLAPMITAFVPNLYDQPGLFTTLNPATGVGAGPDEMYALKNRVTGEAAQLLRITVKPDASVAVLQTKMPVNRMDTSAIIPIGASAWADADLIFHQNFLADGTINAREWILRNPAAVVAETADPRDLKPILDQELARAHDPATVYSPLEIHNSTMQGYVKARPDLVDPIFRGEQRTSPEDLPELFRRHDEAGAAANAAGMPAPPPPPPPGPTHYDVPIPKPETGLPLPTGINQYPAYDANERAYYLDLPDGRRQYYDDNGGYYLPRLDP